MYTDGIVNTQTTALEAIASAMGVPRRWVDVASEVLYSIDGEPRELDRRVRESARWVGWRERSDGAGAEVVGLHPSAVNAEHVLTLKLDECESRLRIESPESLPLPERSGTRASTYAQTLRRHLREVIRTRGTDPRYVARRLDEARERLAMLKVSLDDARPILAHVDAILAELPRADERPSNSEDQLESEIAAAMLAHVERVSAGVRKRAKSEETPRREWKKPGGKLSRPASPSHAGAAGWFGCTMSWRAVLAKLDAGDIAGVRWGKKQVRFDLDEIDNLGIPGALEDADPESRDNKLHEEKRLAATNERKARKSQANRERRSVG